MKRFIHFCLFFGTIFQACGQLPQALPGWEALRCDSTQRVSTLSLYDLILPLYSTDSIREKTIGVNRVLAFVADEKGTVRFLGSHRTGSIADSLGSPTTPLDSIQRHTYLASATDEPIYLYDRWSWLLNTTREVFLARRDSLVDSLRRQLPNYEVKVISDLRSAELQTKLLGRGRSMAPISFHQLGLAADLGFFRRGRLVRNAGPYEAIGELTPYYQLIWGGNFVGFVDPPHFQLYKNAAVFLRDFPMLRFEFEPFYENYLRRVRQKIENNREHEVEDTKALLMILNEFRQQMPCACQGDSLNTSLPQLAKVPPLTSEDVLIFGDLRSQRLSFWRGNELLISYRLGIWQ
ncbi:M15 family metallopeptidase [Siphonobacter curvatus]|uniref:M15 family metallopeptidase n=1 Tax=Siphonobacter curvatus TaxID=2094562 RepID=UPI0010573635|nr:M15 family metallopeptidase [Siphonobacter curvatus]